VHTHCVRRVAVALLLLVAALSATAQRRGGPVTRVPRNAPRIGTSPGVLSQITRTHPEREATGKPFRGPVAFPSASREWIRVETPHFVLISSAGERRTRAIATDLERLTATLTRISAHFASAPTRTRVFVFTNRGDVQPYFDAVRGFERVDATGLTLREPDRSTMLIDANAPGGATLTPRHELVHDLLRRGTHPPPLWIEEGLAEYYSNFGQPIREHVSLIGGRPRIPLEIMFALGRTSPYSGSLSLYAQSWAAVSTLIRRDADAFFAFLDDLRNGARTDIALQKHFRLSPNQLEVAMRMAGMPAPSMARDEIFVAMDVATVDRGTLLAELGDLLASVQGRESDAERHYRAAIERANVLVSEGRIAEAARLVRELAAKLPDQARRELEAQALRLESGAAPGK